MSDMTRKEDLSTVRIRKKLKISVSDWIKTDYAQSLGFSSMSNFMTQAARDSLLRYRGPIFTDIIRYDGYYELFDIIIRRKVEVVISKREMCLKCLECKSVECDHVLFVWNISKEMTHLKQLNFFNPFEHLSIRSKLNT